MGTRRPAPEQPPRPHHGVPAFSIQFVRVPYAAHAELAIARELGMPELDGYESEIIRGVYRGDHYAGESPTYHRPPRTS